MFKVIATDVVVSKGYDNTPALKFSERGDSVRFRIGKKVYDTRARTTTAGSISLSRPSGRSASASARCSCATARSSTSSAVWTRTLGRTRPRTKSAMPLWSYSTRSSTAPAAQIPGSSVSSILRVLRPTLPHPHRLSLSPTTALRGLSLSAEQTHSSMTDQTHHARKGAHGYLTVCALFHLRRKGKL